MRILRVFCALVLLVWAAGLSGPTIRVQVKPDLPLIDSPLSIRISGATPLAVVHVTASTQRYGMTFASSIDVRANHGGEALVDDPMRLIWQMSPAGAPDSTFQFSREYLTEPIKLRIRANDGATAGSTEIARRFMGSGVVRAVIDGNGLVATLFSPIRGTGCLPGIVVLGGSDGGVPEDEAAVLASHGFVTIALAYFGAPGLRRELVDVPIEPVTLAANLLQHRPGACARGVGLLGESKGGELALLVASRLSSVRAVVAYSPASVVFAGIGSSADGRPSSSWSFDGRPLPFANGDVSDSIKADMANDRAAGKRVAYVNEYRSELSRNNDPGAIIPVELIRGPIMLVAGADDELWPSALMAEQIAERLYQHDRLGSLTKLVYPNAGHQIVMPFEMVSAELEHASLALGGSPAANEAADVDAWPRAIAFFRAALTVP